MSRVTYLLLQNLDFWVLQLWGSFTVHRQSQRISTIFQLQLVSDAVFCVMLIPHWLQQCFCLFIRHGCNVLLIRVFLKNRTMRSKRNPSWKTGAVRARAPKVPTLRPSTTFVFKSTACNFCLHVSLNQNKTRHRCSGGSWELWSASLNVQHCWWTLSDATLRNAHRRVNVFKFYSRYVSSCSATPFLNSTVRDPVFRLHRFVAETKRNTEFEHECGPDVVFGHTFSFFFFFFYQSNKMQLPGERWFILLIFIPRVFNYWCFGLVSDPSCRPRASVFWQTGVETLSTVSLLHCHTCTRYVILTLERFYLFAVPNFGVPASAGGPSDSQLHPVIGKLQIMGVFPLPPSDWPCHIAPVVTKEAWGSGTTQPCHLSPDQRGPCSGLTGVKALDEASTELESGAWSTLRGGQEGGLPAVRKLRRQQPSFPRNSQDMWGSEVRLISTCNPERDEWNEREVREEARQECRNKSTGKEKRWKCGA